MTKQTICERSMFTQKKLKGEKQIWRQILHEASLEKIQRINIYWEKKNPKHQHCLHRLESKLACADISV